jgi:hypothetical protein
MRSIVPRAAAALAAVFMLTGSVVVSCDGDSSSTPGSPTDRPASRAFGAWTPPTAQSGETICTKEQHDSYFVIGPDGKKYPTWHPPVLTDAAGNLICAFGHEHGADPSQAGAGYRGWDAVRRHFAYDANGNGAIDDSELANKTGIPFGYANEYATGSGAPLVEPHESYKILFANRRNRQRTFSNQTYNDVVCDQLVAFNQDTASSASFTNNLYSVIVAADCEAAAGAVVPAYRANVILSGLVSYGVANAIADVTATNATIGRQIPTQQRVFNNILVASGQTSDYVTGLRERWNGALTLTRSDSTALAAINIAVGTTDPARFASAATAGVARNSIDVCYTGLDAAGNEVTTSPVRLARGSTCQSLPVGGGPTTGSGPSVPVNSRVTSTSRDSPFRGCQRSTWFGAFSVRNNAGATVWYTDTSGGNASAAPRSGALKQFVDVSDTGNSTLNDDTGLDFSANCAPGLRVRVPN